MKHSLEFNSHFLDKILFNAITSTEFLKKIRNVVDSNTFKTKEKKHILKLIYDYYDEYKEAPKDDFWDIFYESKEYIPNALYERCEKLVNLLSEIGNGNEQYVLNKMREALTHFSLQEGILKAAELIKRKKYDEAKETMLKAFKKPDELERPYYDLLTDTSYKERRSQGKQFKMKTLIKPLDDLIGGFNDWLVVILAKTKGGKTKMLIELSVAATLQGKKVLFVTKEMSKSEVEDGFDQCISFLGSEPGKEIEIMEPTRDGWKIVSKIVPTIFDLDKVQKGRKALKKASGKGAIYIVDKSASNFNYRHLEQILDEMEQRDGIIPDVIVIDYLGEMDATEKGQKKKEKIATNASGLKSIAKSRYCPVITASQGNRSAMSAVTFVPEMISDAIEPVFIADLAMAICQTTTEESMNMYRLFIALFRHGPKGAMVHLIRDTNIGQIALGTPSKKMIEKAQKLHKEKKDLTKKSDDDDDLGY